jgi:hypothetical protein
MDNDSHLIDDHIDGELTGESARQLGDWLRDGDEHVQEFAAQWLIHSLLHDYMSQRQVQADALLRALTTRGERAMVPLTDVFSAQVTPDEPSASFLDDRPSPLARNRLARSRRRIIGVFAAMLVLLAAGTLTYFATRPKVVAMLTQTSNCRWDRSHEAISDGALFHEGDELRLTSGRALITFVSGARVVIDGPTVVTVQSRLAAKLASGVLTATVPGQAVGFTVHAQRVKLVDLGTEFTARTLADGALELQVFDGMVEMTLLGSGRDPADPPLSIAEGTAVRTDAASQKAESIPYDETQRLVMP